MGEEYVKVYIQWFGKELDSSDILPNGLRICTQIKFEEEVSTMPIWTAEIIIRSLKDSFSCYADLRYLFDNAPRRLLNEGKTFMIFDGPNAIGKGQVIEDKKNSRK